MAQRMMKRVKFVAKVRVRGDEIFFSDDILRRTADKVAKKAKSKDGIPVCLGEAVIGKVVSVVAIDNEIRGVAEITIAPSVRIEIKDGMEMAAIGSGVMEGKEVVEYEVKRFTIYVSL